MSGSPPSASVRASPFRGSSRAPRRSPQSRRAVHLGGKGAVECPVYRRPALAAGARIAGPAIVQEHGTTTVLFAGDRCMVVPSGELIIEVGGE